jgi:hypothetical protein
MTDSTVLSGQDIVPLDAGRLYFLPNVYPLDGRACTHPLDSRGYATQNCYLFVEADRALLVDTGFSIHEESMLTRLEALLSPGTRLSLFLLRMGEFYGICNVRPIVERFNVESIYGFRGKPGVAADFRPDYVPYGTPVSSGRLADVQNAVIHSGDGIDLGGGRVLRLMSPPVRLLPTHWLYDEATGTLLTSDLFTYTWRPTSSGPWLVGAGETLPTDAHVRDFMVGSRYWWLPGARTEQMAAKLKEIFLDLEVTRIGPGYGCLIEGPDLVTQHVEIVSRTIEALASERSVGLSAGFTSRSKPMDD